MRSSLLRQRFSRLASCSEPCSSITCSGGFNFELSDGFLSVGRWFLEFLPAVFLVSSLLSRHFVILSAFAVSRRFSNHFASIRYFSLFSYPSISFESILRFSHSSYIFILFLSFNLSILNI